MVHVLQDVCMFSTCPHGLPPGEVTPQSKHSQVSFTGDSKLPVRVNMRVNVYLYWWPLHDVRASYTVTAGTGSSCPIEVGP